MEGVPVDKIELIKNGQKYIMLCDDEDFGQLSSMKIFIGGDGYAVTRIDGKIIRINRMLLNIYDANIIIDHINRNILDNRKENLRISNKQLNGYNENR